MKKISAVVTAFLGFLLVENTSLAKNSPPKMHELDKFIRLSMQKYQVPAVSVAIIEQGNIVYTKAYSNGNLKVNTHSRFQSASVGKSVAAYAALRLIDKGTVNLDTDLNQYLFSWKVPDTALTKKHPVTLRTLLSMTSGLSVPGFIGHSIDSPLPNLAQILRGQPPAENPPVSVLFEPGSHYFYSGGSYEVLEQFIEDVTKNDFSRQVKISVLEPLKMSHSVFIGIPDKKDRAKAIPGFLKDGSMIKGKWNIIPALGAGGMWSTANDLALFTLDVMKSWRGNGLISQRLAKEMLTRQKHTDFGLGFVIDGCGKNLNFRKEGHNIGFYNWLIAFPETRQGLVILTNSENGMDLIKDVVKKTSQLFDWPEHYPIIDESRHIPATSCAKR